MSRGSTTPKLEPGRPGFMEWVNGRAMPDWGLLPLTHITHGVSAEDIARSGIIKPQPCNVFKTPLAYFFYGRAAYRVDGDGVIKKEALCPYCFLFNPALMERSKAIHAFDTGAFSLRMYLHIIGDEMNVQDFRLEGYQAPNKLISGVFGSQQSYVKGDTRSIPQRGATPQPDQFAATAYMDLILSPGRNEPDDRISSIEILFADPIPLKDNLLALIVPHTLCELGINSKWLHALREAKVEIRPYEFMPGRKEEYYHALLEEAVYQYYLDQKIFL